MRSIKIGRSKLLNYAYHRLVIHLQGVRALPRGERAVQFRGIAESRFDVAERIVRLALFHIVPSPHYGG